MRLRSQAGPQFPRLVPSSVGCLPCCEPSLAFATTSPTTSPDVSETSFAFLPCAAASALVSKAAETAGGSFAPLRVPRFARVSLLLSAGCLVLSPLTKKNNSHKKNKRKKNPLPFHFFLLPKRSKKEFRLPHGIGRVFFIGIWKCPRAKVRPLSLPGLGGGRPPYGRARRQWRPPPCPFRFAAVECGASRPNFCERSLKMLKLLAA